MGTCFYLYNPETKQCLFLGKSYWVSPACHLADAVTGDVVRQAWTDGRGRRGWTVDSDFGDIVAGWVDKNGPCKLASDDVEDLPWEHDSTWSCWDEDEEGGFVALEPVDHGRFLLWEWPKRNTREKP